MDDMTPAVLNREVIRQLIGDDKQLIKQFEVDFLKQAKQSLSKIVKLYNDGQITSIKEEAHFLKTSAKAIGAEQTADLLLDLEMLSLEKNASGCGKLIQRVSQSVKLVHGEIVNGYQPRHAYQSSP